MKKLNLALMLAAMCTCVNTVISGPDRSLLLKKRATVCKPGPCRSGEFLDGVHCHSCHPGTFLQVNYLHGCLDCRECSQPDAFLGTVVIEDCTSTSDTVLGCGKGLYRVFSSSEDKLKCMKCLTCERDEVMLQDCSNDADTVCGKATSPIDRSLSTKKLSTSSFVTTTEKPTLYPTDTSARNNYSDDKFGVYLGAGIGIPVGLIVIIITVIVVKKKAGRRGRFTITYTRPGVDKTEQGVGPDNTRQDDENISL